MYLLSLDCSNRIFMNMSLFERSEGKCPYPHLVESAACVFQCTQGPEFKIYLVRLVTSLYPVELRKDHSVTASRLRPLVGRDAESSRGRICYHTTQPPHRYLPVLLVFPHSGTRTKVKRRLQLFIRCLPWQDNSDRTMEKVWYTFKCNTYVTFNGC